MDDASTSSSTTRERRSPAHIGKKEQEEHSSFDFDDDLEGSDHGITGKSKMGTGTGVGGMLGRFKCMSSTRMTVLVILCLQNSMFTVLRRYSQGILKENYSKHEVLLMGELIKLAVAAWMIKGGLEDETTFQDRLKYLASTSRKMAVLALIYGAMNILSFISLRNIGAGMFTIFAQCKILTTATFSTFILNRKYSLTQWRALIALMFGVLLFSEPIWSKSENLTSSNTEANVFVGTSAVLIEVTLSGFASIYFEKVIKTDPLKINIWERNFQLALGSLPVYLAFIAFEGGGEVGIGGGWSFISWLVSFLGAAGGLLVALSIKYGDSILKTLATTGAIILSSVLDHVLLGGPLTPVMMIAGVQVVLAICNYTFDTTPPEQLKVEEPPEEMKKDSERTVMTPDEEVALVSQKMSA
jgi:UDP-sugar transporter A1/2/3